MGALPGVVVRFAPALRVEGGAGIGEEGDGLIGPDAELAQTRTPRFDGVKVIVFGGGEVGLHESDMLFGAD